jgi:S-adenosylmethionine decarboxylase
MSSDPLPLGYHLIADLDCTRGLDDMVLIEATLRAAAEAARVTLLDIRLHHFGEGQGVTGVALLAESHISIHSWPEHGVAAIDIFVCGSKADADAALRVIERELGGCCRRKHLIRRLVSEALMGTEQSSDGSKALSDAKN